MAGKIIEKERYCQRCNKITKHYRKVKNINTVIQIILLIITGGFWAMVWLMPLIDESFKVPFTSSWKCSSCNPRE